MHLCVCECAASGYHPQIFLFLLGFGVGGNLPVDGALFSEMSPLNKRWFLSFMAVFWSVGAVFTAGVPLPLSPSHTCTHPHSHCFAALILSLALLHPGKMNPIASSCRIGLGPGPSHHRISGRMAVAARHPCSVQRLVFPLSSWHSGVPKVLPVVGEEEEAFFVKRNRFRKANGLLLLLFCSCRAIFPAASVIFRFLIVRGRYEEAEKVLLKIATLNKVQLPPFKLQVVVAGCGSELLCVFFFVWFLNPQCSVQCVFSVKKCPHSSTTCGRASYRSSERGDSSAVSTT